MFRPALTEREELRLSNLRPVWACDGECPRTSDEFGSCGGGSVAVDRIKPAFIRGRRCIRCGKPRPGCRGLPAARLTHGGATQGREQRGMLWLCLILFCAGFAATVLATPWAM